MDATTPLSYDDFISWYPEFSELVQGAVERQLDLSNMTLSEPAWGKWWKQACGLFTAHYLAVRFDISQATYDNGVRPATSSIGVVTNKSANTNGLSEGSAVSQLVTSGNPIEADFARTSYGLEYLSLLHMVVPAGNIILSGDASASAGRRWWV